MDVERYNSCEDFLNAFFEKYDEAIQSAVNAIKVMHQRGYHLDRNKLGTIAGYDIDEFLEMPDWPNPRNEEISDRPNLSSANGILGRMGYRAALLDYSAVLDDVALVIEKMREVDDSAICEAAHTTDSEQLVDAANSMRVYEDSALLAVRINAGTIDRALARLVQSDRTKTSWSNQVYLQNLKRSRQQKDESHERP